MRPTDLSRHTLAAMWRLWTGRAIMAVVLAAPFKWTLGIDVAIVAFFIAMVAFVLMRAWIDPYLLVNAPRPAGPDADIAKELRQLNALPMKKAEQMAREALAEEGVFTRVCPASGSPPAEVAQLARGLKAFFTAYSEVAEDEGTCLAWALVGPSELRPGRIRVGDAGEDNGEYSVIPDDEALLYVERPYRRGGPQIEMHWTSVWHLVCAVAGCRMAASDRFEEGED